MSFKVNNFMSITSRVEKSKSERLESVLSGWKDSGGPSVSGVKGPEGSHPCSWLPAINPAIN